MNLATFDTNLLQKFLFWLLNNYSPKQLTVLNNEIKEKAWHAKSKKIADSIFNSKLRYGIHLCGKVRNLDSDPSQGTLDDLQKVQNKLFRLLNNSRISDKINTKSFAMDLNMLNVNQINAQIKLTEMWKASKVDNYPIKLFRKEHSEDNRLTRSIIRGDLLMQCKSELCNASFIQDASKNWNSASQLIKDCNSIYKAKKEIKKLVLTIPLKKCIIHVSYITLKN